jgi:hypothetical protein
MRSRSLDQSFAEYALVTAADSLHLAAVAGDDAHCSRKSNLHRASPGQVPPPTAFTLLPLLVTTRTAVDRTIFISLSSFESWMILLTAGAEIQPENVALCKARERRMPARISLTNAPLSIAQAPVSPA